jgi:hypothetical protein
MTDNQAPPLSPATHTSVVNLSRAKHEVESWMKNLEQALADDVAAGRLTFDQAVDIAEAHEAKPPPRLGSKGEAKETTAEANQAQLDAQTKTAEAEAAKNAKAAAAAAPKEAEGDQAMGKAGDEPKPAAKDKDEDKPKAPAHGR